MKRSTIDGLTFLGDFANTDSQLQLEKYLERNQLLDRRSAKTPYRYQYHLPNKAGVVQFAEQGLGVKPVRMDFNPKRATDPETKRLYVQIIRHLKYIEVSRVDCAFDYEEDLQGVRWMDLEGQKEQEWRFGKKMDLQTVYVGSRNSNYMIVMYNKAEEQRVKEKLALDGDDEQWWRIEVRFQGKESCYQFMIDESFNPFENILTYTDIPIGLGNLKPNDQLKLLGLLTPAGADILSKMSRPSRTKFKKLMSEQTMPTPINPKEDFEAQKKDLRQQVFYWLSHQMETTFSTDYTTT